MQLLHMEYDVVSLSWFFLEKFSETRSKKIDVISAATMAAFENYDWPGNVRELKTVIERSVIMTDGSVLNVDLSYFNRTHELAAATSIPRTLDAISRDCIQRALEHTEWKIEGPNGAAKLLGLKPSTLRWRLKKLDVQRP